jgi:vacuolar-type H+-ATPase subunit H
MKEIVSQILEKEEEATQKINRAREEAENIILLARQMAKEIIAKTVVACGDTANKKKAETEEQFLAEKESIVKKAKEEAILLREKREKDIPVISREVFSTIVSFSQ